MIAVDTNVLVRAAVADDESQSAAARALMSDASALAVSVVVLCEFVWVASSAYRMNRSDIATSIRLLIADPKVVCDREAVALGLDFLENGSDFADGVIFIDGRRLGAATSATFDRKAAKLLTQRGHACQLLVDR